MLNTLQKRLRSEKGFTLIELLVVMIILGILTAIAIPSYLSFKGRAESSAAKSNLRAMLPSVETYYADNGSYTGMNVTGLKAIDQSLNTSVFSVKSVGANTYCVFAKAKAGSTTIFYKGGPAAQMTSTAC